MSTFLSIAFLIYCGMHLYAVVKVWQAIPHSATLGFMLALAGLLLTMSPFFLFYITRQNWHGIAAILSWPVYLWMGFIFLFCVISFVFDSGNALATLLGLKLTFSRLHSLLFISVSACVLAGYGFYDARQIRIERIHIATSKLTGAPVTIAQISDLHLGSMLGEAFLGRVLEKLCELKPDIVVATGDILDGQGDNLALLAQRFRACAPPKGEFAVLGNHEYFVGMKESLQFLRDAGFTVLRGEAVAAGGVVFAGVDDPAGLAMGKEARLNVDRQSLPRDAFIVLLKHQPVIDPGTPFDLQLSGHIHGGQIFPFNFVTQLTYKVDTGLTQLSEGRWLYVSRGTGTWGPPMRLLAPPEIALFSIEPAGHK